jgi:hypothetical protein
MLTDSWPSIAGAGCDLICVLTLQGLRGVERQVGLDQGTRWLTGSSAGRMVARKQDEVVNMESVHGRG